MMGHAAWGAALLRVSLGVIFVMHGYVGFAVLGPATIAGYTTAMGYPATAGPLLAWYLIVAHVVGGALMVVGFLTRPAALAQVPIMGSALFLYHWPQGFFLRGAAMETPGGPRLVAVGYEYALLVFVATVSCVLIGPGAASFDAGRGARVEVP